MASNIFGLDEIELNKFDVKKIMGLFEKFKKISTLSNIYEDCKCDTIVETVSALNDWYMKEDDCNYLKVITDYINYVEQANNFSMIINEGCYLGFAECLPSMLTVKEKDFTNSDIRAIINKYCLPLLKNNESCLNICYHDLT